jgi:anti-anti-sigma factor
MSTTLSPNTLSHQLHLDATRSGPSVTRVAVVGEIDLANAAALHDRLRTALDEQTPAVVVLDLTGVTFLDCAGIGVLVAVHNAAVQTGGQLRVSHPRAAVERLLDMTGLLGVLTAPTDPRQPLHLSTHQAGADLIPAGVEPPGLMAA